MVVVVVLGVAEGENDCGGRGTLYACSMLMVKRVGKAKKATA